MCSEAGKKDELAYALATPYSLHKSRTGGILARLLWTNVKIVAARMYAPRPDNRFIQEYCDAIYDPEARHVPARVQKMLIEYIITNFGVPNARNISNRLVVWIFRGPNAIADVTEAVGRTTQDVRGDNVRGTFGEFVLQEALTVGADEVQERKVKLLSRYPALQNIELPRKRNDFFEPAALTGPTREMTEAHLKVFRKYAYSDGGFVLHALSEQDRRDAETSLVVLKPESFRHRNPLPGNLIDFFARTGMFITAMKTASLSVDEARRFYSLKLPQFTEQLKGMVERKARQIVRNARQLVEKAVEELSADPEHARQPARAIAMARTAESLIRTGQGTEPGELKEAVTKELYRILPERLDSLDPDESVYRAVAEELKELNARVEFDELIRYMTGRDPGTGQPITDGEQALCFALLYSGRNALHIIRERLKELRVVYGRDQLQNRAHASDPDEEPEREIEILEMPSASGTERRPCDVEQVVTEFYGPE